MVAGLELTVSTRPASNLQKYICFCLSSAGITSSHHTCLGFLRVLGDPCFSHKHLIHRAVSRARTENSARHTNMHSSKPPVPHSTRPSRSSPWESMDVTLRQRAGYLGCGSLWRLSIRQAVSLDSKRGRL